MTAPNDHPDLPSESSPETGLWQPGEPESRQTGDETTFKQPEPAPEESVGHPGSIGRYRIERVLGEGGFGLVYLAHDDQLQRLVAIKVPYRRRVSSSEDAEAYLTEARTVANLDHPHIVSVFDVGSSEDCLPGTDGQRKRLHVNPVKPPKPFAPTVRKVSEIVPHKVIPKLTPLH